MQSQELQMILKILCSGGGVNEDSYPLQKDEITDTDSIAPGWLQNLLKDDKNTKVGLEKSSQRRTETIWRSNEITEQNFNGWKTWIFYIIYLPQLILIYMEELHQCIPSVF